MKKLPFPTHAEVFLIRSRCLLTGLDMVLDLPFALYRCANAPAMLIHGFGHALALFLTTRDAGAFRERALLEGLSFSELLHSVLPLQRLPQASDRPPRLQPEVKPGAQSRIVAAGGILLNLLCLVSAWWTFAEFAGASAWGWGFVLALFTSSSLMAMLSIPDWLAMMTGRAPYLACGPAFAVRYKPTPEDAQCPELASERLRGLVDILAKEASTRGGQSGGFSIIVKKLDALSVIFDKVVKGKREDIVRILSQRLLELLRKAKSEGYRKPDDFEVILLHLRYATGGATHWHNAQPHWYEYYDAMMHHRVENGQLTGAMKEVFNMIAHNGDMDGVYLDVSIEGRTVRRYFSQPDARKVLLTLMPWTTSHGDSDSRSVAEWVDFNFTQGLAFKALRFAYLSTGLDFNEHLSAGQVDLDRLHLWAETVDLAMTQAKSQRPEGILKPRARSIDDISESAKMLIRESLAREVAKGLTQERIAPFLACFEEAFYKHDLTWVMRRASRDFVGEFALMVCTTLEPRMGVFSLTQAFSIGHNRTRGEIFGSAEPQGVTSALQQGEETDDALQIYLEDGQFATIEFSPETGEDPVRIYPRAQETDDFSWPPEPAPKTLLDRPEADSIPCDWFAINGNAKIERATRIDTPGEEVANDLKDIPYSLRRVVASFRPGGENAATMEHFSALLFANLLDPERDPRKHDLVLFGVDFNQDLISEFALALGSLIPSLKIRAENSGNVLKEMKRTQREGIGGYGPKTVFLGVSNSAQTQSTLAALRKARDLVGPERCFVLTQSFLNSMSQALGQGFHPEDPMLPNTFVNLSHFAPDGSCGRRRSEAATIVPVATQAVLTEILIGLAHRALDALQTLDASVIEAQAEHFAVRHDLQLTDIAAFREFQAAVYEVEIPNRVGYNAAGEAIDSPDREMVEREARARAENTVEFVRAYALFAAYIIIATVFGVPLFGVLASPLDGIAGIATAAHLLDAALFLTALWLIHLGIRRWQGRPVFERIGARAELYIDRKYIARMVERYNATLFANAPAFVTPYFYWADTVRDALHRYGIRAHRGVVTIHRTPDERMGIEEANNAAEENMVYAQIGGIRFNNGQPQSRDKVRQGSQYENPARPFQTVLSDSLAALREKYNHKLSPETLRLINRRLIDLSDGLVFEFVVGARRKAIVNQSLWDVARWLPFANAIHRLFLQYGFDLKNLTGDADTANQAQIQSTKHPVSPMDVHGETMEPRATVDALRGPDAAQDQSFAVFVFFDNYVSVSFNRHAMLQMDGRRTSEVLLGLGRGPSPVVDAADRSADSGFVWGLRRIGGAEYFVLRHATDDFQMALPTAHFSPEQRQRLHEALNDDSYIDLAAAA